MTDALHELFASHGDPSQTASPVAYEESLEFLSRLTSLSHDSLKSTEPALLLHDSEHLSRTLRGLSKRSYKSIDSAVKSLERLSSALTDVTIGVKSIGVTIPGLENQALHFVQKYGDAVNNEVVSRRRTALILSENMERLSDILELPSLLSSTISASSTSVQVSIGQTQLTNGGYTSALDLYAHIRRIQRLYPGSELVRSIAVQAEDAITSMVSSIIHNLRSQSLKLASGMRLVGLLRRVAPELDEPQTDNRNSTLGTNEGSLGALFLVSRFANLSQLLVALEPLRELADQETSQQAGKTKGTVTSDTRLTGQQTERFLKRYIEITREQCFAIISMYKSTFPTSLPGPTITPAKEDISITIPHLSHPQREFAGSIDDPLQKLPSVLVSFVFETIEVLLETLQIYLPNVRDRSSRESLLTQLLYCASSLGRLGVDFSLVLADLEERLGVQNELATSTDKSEWVNSVRRHRIQANRLESLANSAGTSRIASY